MVLIASGANAENRLVGGVPVPDDVAVTSAPGNLAEAAKALSGVWIGSWGGSLRHVLVVEALFRIDRIEEPRSDATS